jgi:hypothetical protein
MEIKGIEGMDGAQLSEALQQGGKFVIYQYCISIIFMTFRRPSAIYFIPPGQGSIGKGTGFTLLSLLLGWWGIPWGPIYTIGSVFNNLRGGKDVTDDVVASFSGASSVPQAA